MARSDQFACTLTDLHTHILPGIDDGAANLEQALQLLCLQKSKGVERVALTPHFYPLREDLEHFLMRRQRAYELLQNHWDADTMPQLQLGAEAHYSPKLVELDLHRLAIGQGKYLLLELSDMTYPTHIYRVLEMMLEQGIRPVLAHVERCAYFREEPEHLVRLVEAGALGQLSVGAFAKKNKQKFAKICLERNAAHILASDIHMAQEERAWLNNAPKYMREEAAMRAEMFARAIWDNSELPAFKVSPVKKKLFGYG